MAHEFDNTGCFRVTCPNGHNFVALIQNPRFEVLFEMGASALLDGYFREAIVTFAASLERFYEFHLRVLAQAKGVGADATSQAWSDLGNKSERQRGAYVFAVLMDTGECPELPPRWFDELRNAVVHNGKIATSADATKFGDWVLQAIRVQLRYIRDHKSEAQIRVTVQRMFTDAPEDTKCSTHCIGTLISSAMASQPRTPLEQELVKLRMFRQFMYAK
jgi:hypothetical protein